MRPAYQIALNEKELAQLGELTVIMGMVDDAMVQTVAFLLKVDRPAANAIMGSSKVADNFDIWAHTIRNRTNDEDVLWFLELAQKDTRDISKGRNDFIHAVFSHPTVSVMGVTISGRVNPGTLMTPAGPVIITSMAAPPPIARRVRSDVYRPVTELQELINKAATLSCLVAHIDHIMAGNIATTSPWHEKLSQALPPRLDTALARKEKARRGRRRPSPPKQ